jgi:hypothetical protein
MLLAHGSAAKSLSAKEILTPDGCIELIFNLGTPYKRFKSENDFILLKTAILSASGIAIF